MPKPLSGKVLQLEVRVTPHDQERIIESDLQPYLEHIDKLVLCEEGEPNGTPRLHYHGFIETKKSESWLRSVLRKIAHAPDNEKVNGNALYFTRQPHEHTFGYIIKSGNIAHRHGITQTTLDEWLATSNEYKKNHESERKRKQRTRNDELDEIVQALEKDLQESRVSRTIDAVISQFLFYCNQNKVRFPTRSQMDMYILKLVYPYDPYVVRSFYMRSFS